MQRGIGKDSVEWFSERESLVVHQEDIQAAFSRRSKLRQAGIEANYDAACCRDFFRQCAVAAAEIQDKLMRLRLKELQERFPEISNIARVSRVAVVIRGGHVAHRRYDSISRSACKS